MPSNSDQPWGLMVPGRPHTPSEGAAQTYRRVGPSVTQRTRTFDNGSCLTFGPLDLVDEFDPDQHPFGDQVALVDTVVRDCRAVRSRYEGAQAPYDDEDASAIAADDVFNNFRRVLAPGPWSLAELESGSYLQVPSKFASCKQAISIYSRSGVLTQADSGTDSRHGVTRAPPGAQPRQFRLRGNGRVQSARPEPRFAALEAPSRPDRSNAENGLVRQGHFGSRGMSNSRFQPRSIGPNASRGHSEIARANARSGNHASGRYQRREQEIVQHNHQEHKKHMKYEHAEKTFNDALRSYQRQGIRVQPPAPNRLASRAALRDLRQNQQDLVGHNQNANFQQRLPIALPGSDQRGGGHGRFRNRPGRAHDGHIRVGEGRSQFHQQGRHGNMIDNMNTGYRPREEPFFLDAYGRDPSSYPPINQAQGRLYGADGLQEMPSQQQYPNAFGMTFPNHGLPMPHDSTRFAEQLHTNAGHARGMSYRTHADWVSRLEESLERTPELNQLVEEHLQQERVRSNIIAENPFVQAPQVVRSEWALTIDPSSPAQAYDARTGTMPARIDRFLRPSRSATDEPASLDPRSLTGINAVFGNRSVSPVRERSSLERMVGLLPRGGEPVVRAASSQALRTSRFADFFKEKESSKGQESFDESDAEGWGN